MKICFRELLERLAQVAGTPPPSSVEISRETGMPLMVVSRLMSRPHTGLDREELRILVQYLVDRWRPLVQPSVTTQQLTDQIRFELLAFEAVMNRSDESPQRRSGEAHLTDLCTNLCES